jgi:monoamine oxidase
VLLHVFLPLPAAVTAISQDASGVTVTLAAGETLTAPYALITLPLGVLKQGAVTFQPPLPAEKQAAINSMVRV